MKALFISNDVHIFNEESAVRARLRAYANEIGTLYVLSRAPHDIVIDEGSLILHGIAGGRMKTIQELSSRAHALIVSEGIEVVSAQDPFEYGRAALKAVRGTSAKLHIQVHTDFLSPWFTRGGMFRSPQLLVPFKNKIRQYLADRVLPHADGIRVVSERIAQSLRVRYGEKVVASHVIPIAVSTSVPERIPLPAHEFQFTLITVGRLESEKRIDDILEALARVRKLHKTVGLFIVGDGREKSALVAGVEARGLSSCVQFLGARTNAWGLMRSASAYIQASAYEGYGMTLVEAALARLPIITTDVGIVGEVFSGLEDVLTAPPGDPTQLAVNIVSLLEDTGAREVLIRNAEHKAIEHLAQFENLPQLIASDLLALTTGSR